METATRIGRDAAGAGLSSAGAVTDTLSALAGSVGDRIGDTVNLDRLEELRQRVVPAPKKTVVQRTGRMALPLVIAVALFAVVAVVRALRPDDRTDPAGAGAGPASAQEADSVTAPAL